MARVEPAERGERQGPVAPGSAAQEAIATARFIRMSPTKVRQVVDLIRGRHVDDARRVLKFTRRGASLPVSKVLESAVANAEHNAGLPADELVVARAWVDEGPTLKRYRPRALGRATRIRKRTSHISIVVGRSEEAMQVAETRTARRPTARRGTAPEREAAPETRRASGEGASAASERTPKASTRAPRRERKTKKTTDEKEES